MSTDVLVAQLRQQLSRLANRMRHVVQRARVTSAANETGGVQMVQVTNFQGDVTRDVRSYQLDGFASSPLTTCDALIIHTNGDGSFGYMIASNDPTRRPKNMQPGEVRVYVGADRFIKMVPGQPIEIHDPVSVNFNTPVINCTKLVATEEVIAKTVALTTHQHLNSGGNGIGGQPQA